MTSIMRASTSPAFHLVVQFVAQIAPWPLSSRTARPKVTSESGNDLEVLIRVLTGNI